MTETPGLFVPPAYVAHDPAAIVRANPFAMFITSDAAGIYATAAPMCFEFEDNERSLVGHMAGRNPHAKALQSGAAALAIFSGPHAYISASWYVEKPEVPTWNYVAAQVRGTIEPLDDEESKLMVLARTASTVERGAAAPWTLKQALEGRVAFLVPMIRAFRLTIERIEGATKVSQTHPVSDRLRVISHLLQRGGPGDEGVAACMAAQIADGA